MRFLRVLILSLPFWFTGLLCAQEAAAPDLATQAAAAVGSGAVETAPPDFVEYLVDLTLGLFGVKNAGNTWQHWAIAGVITVLFYVLRKIVANFVFGLFKRLTARTRTTLDDELITAWHKPVAAFIAVLGAVIAIKVLKMTPEADQAFRYLKTIAFSVVALWFFISTVSTILDHLQDVAKAKGAAVAAFMPWIKKTLITLFLIFGVLIAAQSLGADVKAFLAGLGIGGLAFALAAQDTLANVFGSVVVAVDQPFKIGETVRIGSFLGMVEDIGLRSTRLRALDKSLVVIPNKTVASEVVTNLSRFIQRRNEQVIGLTYDTPPEQMAAMVEDIKGIVRSEDCVDPASILVFFRDYSASSLDIWIVYVAKDGDFVRFMDAKQRINLAIMRAVQARGLSFAFPTQTLEFGESAARALAARPAPPAAPVSPT